MLKKILIMFGIVFSLGFGYSLNVLEGVNEEKISKVLLQKEYNSQTEIDEFGKIVTFTKRTGKLERKILINYEENKLYKISIYSFDFNKTPNDSNMLENLQESANLLIEGIGNEELINNIQIALKKMNITDDFKEEFEKYEIEYIVGEMVFRLDISGEKTGSFADFAQSLKSN